MAFFFSQPFEGWIRPVSLSIPGIDYHSEAILIRQDVAAVTGNQYSLSLILVFISFRTSSMNTSRHSKALFSLSM